MAVCSLGHEHPDESPAEIIPVPVEQGPNENDVKIAEIEAEASIKREEMYTAQEALRLESRVDELQGKVDGMREVLETVAPSEPPAPPAVIPAPVPLPELAADPTPPPPELESKSKSKKAAGYWDKYQ
ncbi:MAG TPA: hypothetical protein VGG25_31220 [Streptosporangiaceae bacterium]|jgi:hypothetical protein